MKKTHKILLKTLLLALVLSIVSIPLINNYIAYSVKRDLIKLPLPDKTEMVDSLSSAGKLVGEGNGMQYFGAILIESQLTEDELNQFYSKYRDSEWEYIVEKQEQPRIPFIDHRDLSFDIWYRYEGLRNHYIIYTWGSSHYPLGELDLRGH